MCLFITRQSHFFFNIFAQNAELQKQLAVLKESKDKMSEKDKKRINADYDKAVQEWRKRKRIVSFAYLFVCLIFLDRLLISLSVLRFSRSTRLSTWSWITTPRRRIS